MKPSTRLWFRKLAANLLSVIIAAAFGFSAFLFIAGFPVLIGKEGYIVVWGYIGIPLGMLVGIVCFLPSIPFFQKYAKKLFGVSP
jgi:hypothetical protein